MSYVGQEFDAINMPAWNNRGEDIHISGRYEVVEYECEDRSAGIIGSSFILLPVGTTDEDEGWETDIVTVDPWDLFEAIDPEGFQAELDREAEYEREMQDQEREWDDLNTKGF